MPFDKFTEFCTKLLGLSLSYTRNILQFLYSYRISRRHGLKRNILKNDIRRQTYFFRQLFAQIFQHLKKSRIYS